MRTRGIFQPYLSDYNNSKFILKTSCQEVFWKYQIGKGKEIILSDSSCIIQGARRPRNSHFCKFTDKTCEGVLVYWKTTPAQLLSWILQCFSFAKFFWPDISQNITWRLVFKTIFEWLISDKQSWTIPLLR